MLVYQAAIAFNIWTGREMPVTSVLEMLEKKLKVASRKVGVV
jgi:shikimate 5-dehydrogenase